MGFGWKMIVKVHKGLRNRTLPFMTVALAFTLAASIMAQPNPGRTPPPLPTETPQVAPPNIDGRETGAPIDRSSVPGNRTPAPTTDRPGRGRGSEGTTPETTPSPVQPPAGTALRPGEQVQRVNVAAPRAVGTAGGSKETPPQIQFPVAAAQASLHFDPLDIQVDPGAEFETSLILTNRANQPVDRVEITVLVDPNWLTLVSFDARNLAKFAKDGEKGVQVTTSADRLTIEARMETPLSFERSVLATFKFKASDNSGMSSLAFAQAPDGKTLVAARDTEVIGGDGRGMKGLLDSRVFIARKMDNVFLPFLEDYSSTVSLHDQPIDWTAEDRQLTKVEAQAKRNWNRPPQDARLDDTAQIALQGPENRLVERGQVFWVDLVLRNPTLAPIDSLGARVEFDPSVLQVVDQDQDNWITTGVNAWDGAFHKDFPFDFHQSNKADNRLGFLRYQAGRQYGPWQFPSGIFARIQFRALKSTDAAIVKLSRGSAGQTQTFVRSYGLDRMADVWEQRGAPAVKVQVVSPVALSMDQGAR